MPERTARRQATVTTMIDIAMRMAMQTRGWVVPHTGIAASLRWSPTECGCYGGLRPAPMDSGRLKGTNEGTARVQPSTKQ